MCQLYRECTIKNEGDLLLLYTYSILLLEVEVEMCPLSYQKGELLKLEMAKIGLGTAVENNFSMKLDNSHNYIFSGTRLLSFTLLDLVLA